MKIQTSELIGPALDWAVAKIIATEEEQLSALKVWHGEPFLLVDGGNPRGPARRCNFSTDWVQGGPIVEREKIDLEWEPNGKPVVMARTWDNGKRYRAYGPTPLIATVRCYVASKLGDEVDVPEELMK